MNLTMPQVTIFLGILAAFPVNLPAGVIASASANWTGSICPSGSYGNCDVARIPVADSQNDTGINVSVHVSPPSPGIGGATGLAVAGYGNLSVFAGANTGLSAFTNLMIYLMQASASASFEDSITIFGGSGGGTIEAVGSFYCCVLYEGYGGAEFHIGTAGTGVGVFRALHSTPFDIMTPFTFGAPLNISGSANAEARDLVPYDAGSGSSEATAQVFLSKLIVRDANGQAIAGYSYSSASGSSYALQDGVMAPEPGSLSMVLLALTVVGTASIRFKIS